MKKILNILSYVFTILTLVTMIVVQNNLYKVAFVVGIGTTLIGIINILNSNNYGYLVFSPGVSLFTAVLMYKYSILNKSECVTLMISMSIFILMTITLITKLLNKKKVHQIYDKIIEAHVSDLIKNPNTKKEYYQIIYEYVVGKNLYTVGTPYYVDKFIPRIGDKLNLRISSKDYSDVFFEKRLIDKIYENGLVVGLMIVTLIIIVCLFI